MSDNLCRDLDPTIDKNYCNMVIDNNNMSKEEFMEIYKKVKTGEMDTLDEEILYKIMIILNE